MMYSGLIKNNAVLRWLRSHLGMNAAIAVFCTALFATFWWAAIKQAQTEREEVIAGAIRQNSNLAIAFEEHTTRTIKEVDAAVLFITHEYARLGTALDLAGYINDGYIDGKLFTLVGIVSAGGDLLLSTQPFKPVNLSDREHIRVHVLRDSGRLFIGKPVLSRAANTWSIPMTRRITNVDGSFGGVVVALVDPDYFTNFYQKTDLGQYGLVNLVGFDGVSRARRVGKAANSDLEMSNTDVLQEQAKNGVGSFLSSAGAEGVARYTSYRTVQDYTLVVAVGTSQQDVLGAFNAGKRQDYWALVLVIGVIALFAGLLMSALARQKRAIDALTASETRFRATFDQAAIGMARVEPKGRFLQVNQKMCDMLGYSREELLAMTAFDIVLPEERNAYAGERAQLISGEFASYSREMRYVRKDGVLLWVNRTVSLVRDAAGLPLYFIRVMEDITERKHLQQELQHLAHHDSLTRLPNRKIFYDRLEHALGQARRRDWNTGVMFIDLDGFKVVNDTLGHGVGDQLLQQVSARLTQCVRADDTLGRLGGDEFAVILSEFTRKQDGGLVARKIIDALAKPFQIDGREVRITASIGIAICPPDSSDAGVLLSNADAAMYAAKKLGKNNYQFFNPDAPAARTRYA